MQHAFFCASKDENEKVKKSCCVSMHLDRISDEWPLHCRTRPNFMFHHLFYFFHLIPCAPPLSEHARTYTLQQRLVLQTTKAERGKNSETTKFVWMASHAMPTARDNQV